MNDVVRATWPPLMYRRDRPGSVGEGRGGSCDAVVACFKGRVCSQPGRARSRWGKALNKEVELRLMGLEGMEGKEIVKNRRRRKMIERVDG